MESHTQLVIVNGRRSVGKTYLINHFFHNKYAFRITGVQNNSREDTLATFAEQLSVYSGNSCSVPGNWRAAFMTLRSYLDTRAEEEKVVVFFDEMQWLAVPSSEFMLAFETFWSN